MHFLLECLQVFGDLEPTLPYTTIPLDTTQCVPFPDICSAMKAITDNLNKNVYLRECFLSSDCLTISCYNIHVFTLTISPCNYGVTIWYDFDRFEFTESSARLVFPYFGNIFLLDVTIANLQDGEAMGLQVRVLNNL